MGNTTTQTPEPGRLDQSASSGTGVGPGRAPAGRSKLRVKILLAALGLVLIVISVLLYRHLAGWESTDDAQIDGYIYPASARIPGYVTRVTVDDNQYVEA